MSWSCVFVSCGFLHLCLLNITIQFNLSLMPLYLLLHFLLRLLLLINQCSPQPTGVAGCVTGLDFSLTSICPHRYPPSLGALLSHHSPSSPRHKYLMSVCLFPSPTPYIQMKHSHQRACLTLVSTPSKNTRNLKNKTKPSAVVERRTVTWGMYKSSRSANHPSAPPPLPPHQPLLLFTIIIIILITVLSCGLVAYKEV